MNSVNELLPVIRTLHERIRDAVVDSCERNALESLSRVDRDEEGDTIYAVDRVSEELIVDFFEREVAPYAAVVLIAEGLKGGQIVLPRGTPEAGAVWRIIVDPIDGTRGLMYQKRSAWVLTGVAPNKGAGTNLSDIELAVQTEIPLVKQHLSDALWALRGSGADGERFNRLTGERNPLRLQPSGAPTIAHGYACIARFFPGAREELAAIDEEIISAALGPVQPGKAHCFEDQYASSAGQLYELMAGHDRFIADLRPLMEDLLKDRGSSLGICCHPYDLCTELIARELGVVVTGAAGEPLRARLAVEPDVAWAGYANKDIRAQIEPLLRASLKKTRFVGSCEPGINHMYRIVHGPTSNLPDVAAFVRTVETLPQHQLSEARELFNPQSELFVARAPGRLDVMGGIADYSGSLALELPIREATLVALQMDESREMRIVSLGATAAHRTHFFEMPLADFEHNGEPISYEASKTRFSRVAETRWAAYVAGAFLVLMRERGVRFTRGARLLIDSQVPEAKGVSSSAAIEVAVMSAVVAAFDIALAPRDLALLCQKVENLVVGAPCGVMDQMTAACGEDQNLLALLCQPAELQAMRRIPDEIAVWGIDSGIRHSVGGGDYGSVRTGAFMGYRIIAELAGLDVEETALKGVVRIRDPKWGGYLANLGPAEFESYAERLPDRIAGAEFLTQYKGITDSVTRVRPDRSYSVLAPTAHPVYENARVRRFAELLSEPLTECRVTSLGGLMYDSHASYSACGLGSAGTDLLVNLIREAGEAQGVYGAKITGGGSGGTVAVLGRRGADAAIEQVADEYERKTNYRPFIFHGSSPGAAAFGHLKLAPEK